MSDMSIVLIAKNTDPQWMSFVITISAAQKGTFLQQKKDEYISYVSQSCELSELMDSS